MARGEQVGGQVKYKKCMELLGVSVRLWDGAGGILCGVGRWIFVFLKNEAKCEGPAAGAVHVDLLGEWIAR